MLNGSDPRMVSDEKSDLAGSYGIAIASTIQVVKWHRLELGNSIVGMPLVVPTESETSSKPKIRAIYVHDEPRLALGATLANGWTVFNTHLDRASQPDETLQAQVTAVTKVLDKYESQGLPWLIGGDFNLLPLGQYRRLPAEQRTPYSADSELHLLWDKYPMIPTNNEASGIDRAHWLTHYPNDPGLNGPDRTVDYLFYSPKIKRVEAMVRASRRNSPRSSSARACSCGRCKRRMAAGSLIVDNRGAAERLFGDICYSFSSYLHTLHERQRHFLLEHSEGILSPCGCRQCESPRPTSWFRLSKSC